MCAHSYNIEYPNPWEIKGYLATVTIRPLTEEGVAKCFVEWKGSWESNGPKTPDVGSMVGKGLQYNADVLNGKRKAKM